MTIEIGFGLITCQRHPGDARTDVERYADAIALAEHAERIGFDSIWVSEHHFVDDGYLPSLLPLLAAIAVRTERVRLGTALLLAPLHEPLRVAEDVAVVDLISGGRVVLGVGLGWREEEFAGLGVPLTERVPRLLDSIEVYRQAWRGELVTGGELLRYPGVPVRPRPAQPHGPPIWVGALVDRAIERAGRVGDGFMATDVTDETLRAQVALARSARDAAGRTGPFTVSVHLPTFAWHGDDAWDLVRESHRYVAWKYDDMETARRRSGDPGSPPPLDQPAAEDLRRGILLGSPEEVADRIKALADAAGGDLHFIARLYFPGLEPAVQRQALNLFAEEVIPRLR